MFKIFSNSLLFLFLFVAVGFFIFRDPIYEATADKCSAEYQTWKISKLNDDMENKERLSDKRLKNLVKFENALAKLPNGDTPEIRNTFFQYMIKSYNNCPMPEGLENKITGAVLPIENAGDRTCPLNAYYKESQRELKDIKYHKKKTHIYLERMVYDQIKTATDDAVTQQFFDDNWKSQKFRDRLITASIQVTKREKYKCRDINLPMLDITKGIMRNAVQKIKDRKKREN